MSACINVDRIAPKHASSVNFLSISTAASYNSTVSAPLTIGGTTTDTTVTGNLVISGNVCYLSLPLIMFTGVSGSAASCALLAGHAPSHDARLLTLIFDNNGMDPLISTGSALVSAGTGVVTFYSDVGGSGWGNGDVCTVFASTYTFPL